MNIQKLWALALRDRTTYPQPAYAHPIIDPTFDEVVHDRPEPHPNCRVTVTPLWRSTPADLVVYDEVSIAALEAGAAAIAAAGKRAGGILDAKIIRSIQDGQDK